jgi:AcrR family transcriptional regulator
MDETTGLRERKKAETRNAISKAVMLLALDRGFDAVTADDIAAAANVSVRTFHNYFGSKEEALVAAWRSEFEVHLDELRARPADEPILVSLEHVFAGIAERIVAHPSDTAVQGDLLWTSTVMAHRRTVLLDEAIRIVTGIVADRTGTDVTTDIYPHLVTASAITATVTAFQFAPGCFDADCAPGGPDPVKLLHQGFALLRAGLERAGPVGARAPASAGV